LHVSWPVTLDVSAQPVVTNCGGINLVCDWVEAVKRHSRAAKGGATAQPDVDAKSVPAIDDRWPDGHVLQTARRNEELPQECIECADKIRVAMNDMKAQSTAFREKLVDGRIGERQNADAFSWREAWRNYLNAFNDRARLSAPRASSDESFSSMLGEGALLRSRLAHPATARIACRR
jgi:hypothetical protein